MSNDSLVPDLRGWPSKRLRFILAEYTTIISTAQWGNITRKQRIKRHRDETLYQQWIKAIEAELDRRQEWESRQKTRLADDPGVK